MPKNKRLESDSGSGSSSDSGPDDPTPPKKSKPEAKQPSSSKGKKSSSDDGETRLQLDKNRYVTVREFRGKVFVDIREFYTTADGEERPGKKGISLSTTQWSKLKTMIEEVDDAVAKF